MASDLHAGPGEPLSAPSRNDAFVRDASGAIGGPVGRHTRFGAAAFWTPLRVLIALTMLTFTIGFAAKLPCSYHPWAEHYQYTRMCYSDVYALYFSERLNEAAVPYVDHPVEYPVVIGGLMWVAAGVSDDASDFYAATAVLLLVSAVVAVAFTAKTAGRRRPWDAALFALAPGMVLHATTNWDLAAVALGAVGMWAWSRKMPAFAGIWFGLAIATKLYPGLFLVGLLFLCLRAKRMAEWVQAAAVAGATAVLVYVPVILTAGRFPVEACEGGHTVTVLQPAWQRFFTLNRCRGADWDSMAYAFTRLTDRSISTPALNRLTAVLVILVILAVGALTLWAPRRPRVAQVMFLLVAGFLLVNKVNSPQYTLWLIPLAALARPRWRAFLAWQAAEALVLFTRFYFFVNYDDNGKGIPVEWFIRAVLLRNVLLLVLMGLVVREILRPYHDVVRRDGEDDPAGGVLDGALDRKELAATAPVPAPA
ncbi:MAG TPA: glycosyltransferase 87 family protein [Frankiaceae bacterium]|nr:glycosyltransferase 87 family protein [Frankiaceae bacterium]